MCVYIYICIYVCNRMFCEYIKLVDIDDLFDDVVLRNAPVHQRLVAIALRQTFCLSHAKSLRDILIHSFLLDDSSSPGLSFCF